MSSLHLSHALPWHQLAESDFTSFKNGPGIKLPVGSCGLIHVTSKKIKCQVEHRKYLQDKVCPSDACETTGEKLFHKSGKKFYSLGSSRVFGISNAYFIDCFKKIVTEFAEFRCKKMDAELESKEGISDSENRTKVVFIGNEKQMNECHEMIKTLSERRDLTVPIYTISCNRIHYHCYCNCEPIVFFVEEKNFSTVLSFNNQIIKNYFSCNHGHSVGKNFAFLLTNVFQVYTFTNLILCCNLENEPEKWREMSPKTFFRQNLNCNRDCITFLESSRKYLADDVYMKDFNAMKQLMKNCFEFIYVSKILYNKVYPDRDFFDDCMYYCFDSSSRIS